MDSADDLKLQQRNAFLESLSPAARDRFLAELEKAAVLGLDEETAWQDAVIAAETTYSGSEPAAEP